MSADDGSGWRTRLVTAGSLRNGHGTRRARSSAPEGLVRVRRGVYLDARTWSEADADDRYRWLLRATAVASAHEPVFTHLSAARLWELPQVGRWPERPDILVAPGVEPSRFVDGHRGVGAANAVRGGLRVTALPRTVLDVSRTAHLSTALAMADAALSPRRPSAGLPLVTLGQLTDELAALPRGARGRRMAGAVIDLADGDSGSPGESLSRGGMHVLGFPPPLLQKPFFDTDGLIGYVDFFWPEFRLVGEFDGLGKYLREEWRDGRSPAQVVIDEKIREDRLRALGLRVTRWSWSTARSLPRLRAHLLNAGLPAR